MASVSLNDLEQAKKLLQDIITNLNDLKSASSSGIDIQIDQGSLDDFIRNVSAITNMSNSGSFNVDILGSINTDISKMSKVDSNYDTDAFDDFEDDFEGEAQELVSATDAVTRATVVFNGALDSLTKKIEDSINALSSQKSDSEISPSDDFDFDFIDEFEDAVVEAADTINNTVSNKVESSNVPASQEQGRNASVIFKDLIDYFKSEGFTAAESLKSAAIALVNAIHEKGFQDLKTKSAEEVVGGSVKSLRYVTYDQKSSITYADVEKLIDKLPMSILGGTYDSSATGVDKEIFSEAIRYSQGYGTSDASDFSDAMNEFKKSIITLIESQQIDSKASNAFTGGYGFNEKLKSTVSSRSGLNNFYRGYATPEGSDGSDQTAKTIMKVLSILDKAEQSLSKEDYSALEKSINSDKHNVISNIKGYDVFIELGKSADKFSQIVSEMNSENRPETKTNDYYKKQLSDLLKEVQSVGSLKTYKDSISNETGDSSVYGKAKSLDAFKTLEDNISAAIESINDIGLNKAINSAPAGTAITSEKQVVEVDLSNLDPVKAATQQVKAPETDDKENNGPVNQTIYQTITQVFKGSNPKSEDDDKLEGVKGIRSKATSALSKLKDNKDYNSASEEFKNLQSEFDNLEESVKTSKEGEKTSKELKSLASSIADIRSVLEKKAAKGESTGDVALDSKAEELKKLRSYVSEGRAKNAQNRTSVSREANYRDIESQLINIDFAKKEAEKAGVDSSAIDEAVTVYERELQNKLSTLSESIIKDYLEHFPEEAGNISASLGNASMADNLNASDIVKDIVSNSDSDSDIGDRIKTAIKKVQDDQLKSLADIEKSNVIKAEGQVKTASDNNSTSHYVQEQQKLIDSLVAYRDALEQSGASASELSKVDLRIQDEKKTLSDAEKGVSLEAVNAIKQFKDQLKNINSDKSLSVEQKKAKANEAVTKFSSSTTPPVNEATSNAYKEALADSKTYVNSLSEEIKKRREAVAVSQQEERIASAGSTKDKAAETRKLGQIYREQAASAKDAVEQSKLLAKAAQQDAAATRLSSQAKQELNNAIKSVANSAKDFVKSLKSAIDSIVSLSRQALGVANKLINFSVNGMKNIFSTVQRVINLFGNLSNRVRGSASALYNFARSGVQSIGRLLRSVTNLTKSFVNFIRHTKGSNTNVLKMSMTELNSAISLAERAFNGLFNNRLLGQAIKFDSTIASITMLLGDKATDQTREFANSLQSAFGISAKQTISDLQEITSLLKAAGLEAAGVSGEGIAAAARDFYSMSQYMAALGMAGGSATEVMNKLESGLKGMTQSIDDLGLSVRESDMNEFLKEHNLDVKFSGLSEANKETVRLAAIIDQFKRGFNIGDYPKLLNQTYYRVSLIKSGVTEIGTLIGKIFEGILSKFLPYIMSGIYMIQDALKGLAVKLGIDIEGEKVQKELSKVTKGSKQATKATEELTKASEEYDGTAGFDELESLSSGSSSDSSMDLSSLLSDVGSISNDLENSAKNQGSITKRLREEIAQHLEEIKQKWSNFVKSKLGEGVDVTFGFNLEEAKKSLKKVWKNIKRWWKSFSDTWLYIGLRVAEDMQVGKLVNDILSVIEAMTRFGAVFQEFLDPIIRSVYDKYLSDMFKEAGKSLDSFLVGLKDMFDIMSDIFSKDADDSAIMNSIKELKKNHPVLAGIAEDFLVMRDNFGGFLAIFKDSPSGEELNMLGNLKQQMPILTRVLTLIDDIKDIIGILFNDYVLPLLNKFSGKVSAEDVLDKIHLKLEKIKGFLSSTDFKVTFFTTVDDVVADAKAAMDLMKQATSSGIQVAMSIISPGADGESLFGKLSETTQDVIYNTVIPTIDEAGKNLSDFVYNNGDKIDNLFSIVSQGAADSLGLLLDILGEIGAWLTENPELVEKFMSVIKDTLQFISDNSDTILFLLGELAGLTFDSFGSLRDSLQPVFDTISENKEDVSELFAMFGDFTSEAFKELGEIVAQLIQDLIANKDDVKGFLDKIIGFLDFLSNHTGIIEGVFKIAVISKIASSLGSILSPLGSLIGLLSKMPGFSNVFKTVGGGIKDIVTNLKNGGGLKTAKDAIVDVAKKVPKVAGKVASSAKTLVGGVANTAKSIASKGIAGAGKVLGTTAGATAVGVTSIAAGVAGAAKDAYDGVTKFCDENSTMQEKVVAGLTSAVMSDESGLTGAVKNGTKWASIGAGIGTFIAPGIGTAIGGGIGALVGGVTGAIDTESVINTVNGAVDSTKEFAKNVTENVSEGWNNVKDKASNFADTVKTKVSDSFNNASTNVKNFADSIKTNVSEGWQNAKEKMTEAADGTIFEGFVNNVTSDIDTITSGESSIGEKIGATIKLGADLATSHIQIFKGIGDDIKDSLANPEETVAKFNEAYEGAKKVWNNAGIIFKGIGRTIATDFLGEIDKIKTGFSDIMNNVKDKAVNTFNNISESVSGWWDGVVSFFDSDNEEPKVTSGSQTNNPKNQGNNVSMPGYTGTTTTTSGNYQTESVYKGLSTSAKSYVDSIMSQYNAGKLNKLDANSKLASYKIRIRKLGGSVPKGSLFLANEPGNPELIGKIGGSTGTDVANRSMITEAMEIAVYNGMVDAINSSNQTINSKSTNTGTINISGFGLIDKAALRKLASLLAPFLDANSKSFVTS